MSTPGRAEVDGVPVLLAPPGDGPCIGAITFRVGTVDEPPRLRGVTHLVEHLALGRLTGADSHSNGETTAETTTFYRSGSAAEVARFLTAVCRTLGDLPLGELNRERSVLRAEQARRRSSLIELLDLYRFGSRSYGRPWLDEWGLPGLGPEDVRGWAARFFTAGNAVCWLAADGVPADLRLPLAPGPRLGVPPAVTALPRTPAWFAAGDTGIAWSGVATRSAAAGLVADVLRRDLFRSLRTEAGISYAPDADLRGRAHDQVDVIMTADALSDQLDAALGGVLRCLLRLKNGIISADDLAAARTEGQDALARADAERLLLPSRARDLLLDRPDRSATDRLAELGAVTPDEVAAAGRAAFASGLLLVPAGRSADHAGFVRAPDTSPVAITGTTFGAPGNPYGVLTVGPVGVSWSDGTSTATVPYADCEALLIHPDGGRRLLGADASFVAVEPTRYPTLEFAVPGIDEAVPRSAHVLTPRDPADVPTHDPAALAPATGSGRRSRAGRGAGPTWWGALTPSQRGFLLPVAVLVLGFVVLAVVMMTHDGDPTPAIVGAAFTAAILTALTLVALRSR